MQFLAKFHGALRLKIASPFTKSSVIYITKPKQT